MSRARRALDLAGRARTKPPRYVVARALSEARREGERGILAAARRGRGPLAAACAAAGRPAALDRTADAAAALGAWSRALDVVRADPTLRAAVRARADRALRGEVELFGTQPLVLARPFTWHADPHTGDEWPVAFHRRVDYRNLDRSSDVKLPWELARLRPVVALAQAAAAFGDVEALTVLEGDVAGFAAANPIGYGIHWACAMEVALRAVNLICADAILLAGRVGRRRSPLVALLYGHGWFLARNLELADVNGNHFLADATGLVWLGRYLDGVGEASTWRRTGVAMVERAAREHVLDDGLDQEGSLRYHALVLELFLAARAAEPALATIDPVLRRMATALRAIAGPDGRVPDLGDDDGGRALALSDAPSDDARRVLALAAALLERAPAGPPDADWGADALWLTGAVPTPALGGPPRRLPVGGVVVLGEGDDRVTVDVGPIGFRGRGGHGHVDALSFEARLGGALAVPDSGTGSYSGDPALRQELRDAPAHTVVVVDGLPYGRIGGVERLWSIDGDAPPLVLDLRTEPGRHRLAARQVVPAAAGSATVERRLEWQPGRVAWDDVVTAPAGATIVHHVQLPALPDEVGPDRVAAAGFVLTVALPPGGTLAVETGRRSRAYASSEPAARALVRHRSTGEPVTVGFAVERLDP